MRAIMRRGGKRLRLYKCDVCYQYHFTSDVKKDDFYKVKKLKKVGRKRIMWDNENNGQLS